ncbi:hypothetical protein P3S68_003060 [Capsicum galapagoense]
MEKAFSSFLLIVLLLLHYVMASSAMTKTNITTDQLALLSLKSQIIFDPSHFLDESWSPAISICHWVGVTCGSRIQRVKSLNLSNMALIGRIPSELGNLSFLVSLDLGSNNFHGNLPQEMACLRRLKFLDLSVNNFSGKVPSLFGLLHHLQVLNLGNNSFTGSIPCSFSNISTLETLNLKFNSIEGQIPKALFLCHSQMPQGWRKPLPENEFDGPIHSEIGRLSNLQILGLRTNHFTEIGNLFNLVELAMEENQITSSVPISKFNISSLQLLSAWKNNLSGFLPREIKF